MLQTLSFFGGLPGISLGVGLRFRGKDACPTKLHSRRSLSAGLSQRLAMLIRIETLGRASRTTPSPKLNQLSLLQDRMQDLGVPQSRGGL